MMRRGCQGEPRPGAGSEGADAGLPASPLTYSTLRTRRAAVTTTNASASSGNTSHACRLIRAGLLTVVVALATRFGTGHAILPSGIGKNSPDRARIQNPP